METLLSELNPEAPAMEYINLWADQLVLIMKAQGVKQFGKFQALELIETALTAPVKNRYTPLMWR